MITFPIFRVKLRNDNRITSRAIAV